MSAVLSRKIWTLSKGDINCERDNETHIGDNGKAEREQHNTSKPNPKYYTDPYDHKIEWDDRGPHPEPPINNSEGATE